MSDIKKRKIDHINLALDSGSQSNDTGFSRYRLNYQSMPELSLNEVCTSTVFMGYDLNLPMIVTAMTGGPEKGNDLNKLICDICSEKKIGFSLGSCRVLLEDRDLLDLFKFRDQLINVPFIANLGLVQMNYGVVVEDIQWLVDSLEVDCMCFHLNPLQEALQVGGDTDFSDLYTKLRSVVKSINIPVMVKDVGFGLAPNIVDKLAEIGVEYVDLAGRGGTNWAYIENRRSSKVFDVFNHEGHDIVDLLEKVSKGRLSIIAGGGIRSGVDIFKALSLGANAVSVGQPILMAADKGSEYLRDLFDKFEQELKISMFVTGCDSIDDLIGNLSLLT